VKVHLRLDEVAAPAQDGVGLEQEQHLVQLGFSVAPQANKFAGKDSQGELLPARNAGCLRMAWLEDAQLLAQQQDFEVLIALGAASDGEEVEQQQDDLSKKKVEHRLTACMSCAGPRVPGRCRSRAAHSAAVRIFRTLQAGRVGDQRFQQLPLCVRQPHRSGQSSPWSDRLPKYTRIYETTCSDSGMPGYGSYLQVPGTPGDARR
jgi:hypothetical protein